MLGLHVTQLADQMMIVDFLKYIWVAQIIYTFAIANIKFVVLAFYWRLFSVKMRAAIWIVAGMCIAWFIAIVSVSQLRSNDHRLTVYDSYAVLYSTASPSKPPGTLHFYQ